ncbi:uncharacterized protein LOC141532126 isoform X2 [Cotesia typhae]|uniref:uncharacterized protein LOC141532126 isoform X2 n=1 Tax=Cotesia typhae TaxID=2053667 RepID=UPI003D6949D8
MATDTATGDRPGTADLQYIVPYEMAIHCLMYKLLICSKRNSLNCNAQGFLDDMGNFQYVSKDGNASGNPTNPHCHEQNENITEVAAFFQQLHAAVVHTYLSYSVVYDDLKDLYPNAAEANSFSVVVPRMRQWRASRKFPDLAGDLNIFMQLVENDPDWKKLKCYDNGFMTFKSIESKAATRAIVFGDVEFAASIHEALHKTVFLEEAPITIRGMIGSRVIIATVPHKNYAFPVAWAVITNDPKSESYGELIRGGISRILGGVQPQTVYFDFGAEMFLALSIQYRASRLRGTFDAYCNLLYTNVSDTVQLRGANNQDAVRVFSQLIILSLLPPEKIIDTFCAIVQHLSEPLFNTFEIALQYYLREWLNKVGVSNLSFYHDLDALGNCSKLHCTRLTNIAGGNPDLWNFLRSTITIQNRSFKDSDKLKTKKTIVNGTSRVGMLVDSRKIKKLQSMLINEEITSFEFLSRGWAAVEHLVADLIFLNPPLKKNHQVVDLVPIHHKLCITVNGIRALEPSVPEMLLEELEVPIFNTDDNALLDAAVAADDGLLLDAGANAYEVLLEAGVHAELEVPLVGDVIDVAPLDARVDTEVSLNGRADVDDDDDDFGFAAGGQYYKITKLCLICGQEDSPPNVIYNPCRHCIICQGCQTNHVAAVISYGEIFKCAYCRADVMSIDLII